MTRPPLSRSTVATWPASSHGLRRDGGVSIVPSLILLVRTAATARLTQASTPHTGSHTKMPSHPLSSAVAARSPMSAASAHGITKPNLIHAIIGVPTAACRDGATGVAARAN